MGYSTGSKVVNGKLPPALVSQAEAESTKRTSLSHPLIADVIGILLAMWAALLPPQVMAALADEQWAIPEDIRTFDAPETPSVEPLPTLVSKLAKSLGTRRFVDLDAIQADTLSDLGAGCINQARRFPYGSLVAKKKLNGDERYEFYFGDDVCDKNTPSVKFTLHKAVLNIEGIQVARYSFSPTARFFADPPGLRRSDFGPPMYESQILQAIRNMALDAENGLPAARQARDAAIEKEKKKQEATKLVSGLVDPAGGFFIRPDNLWALSDERFDGVATCYPSNLCVLNSVQEPLARALKVISDSCLSTSRYYSENGYDIRSAKGIRINPRQGMPFDVGGEKPLTARAEDEDYQAATDLLLEISDRDERTRAFASAKSAILACKDQISKASLISAQISKRKDAERSAKKITDSINDCRRAVALFDVADERWKESWIKYFGVVKPYLDDPAVKANILAVDAMCWPGEGSGEFPKAAGVVIAEIEQKEREIAKRQEADRQRAEAESEKQSQILTAAIKKYYGPGGGLKGIPLGQQCEKKASLAVKVFQAGGDLDYYRNQYQTGSLKSETYATMGIIQHKFGLWMPMSEEQAEDLVMDACRKGEL